MNYLLSGTSGLVGSQLLEQLLNDPTTTSVISIGRKNLSMAHPKMIQIEVDFNQLNNLQLTDQIDVAFCALGTTLNKAGSKEKQIEIDKTYVVNFCGLAKNNGAKSIGIVSSLGSNAKSSNFYLRVKGEMEQEVEAIGIDKTVFIRPSMLLGNRKEYRFGEKVGAIVLKIFQPLLIGSWKKYRGVHVRDVARTLITETKNAVNPITIIESDQIIKQL